MSISESNTEQLSSLTFINKEIHSCVNQLNAVVYLELELDRQDVLFRSLVEQIVSLQEAKDAVKRDLEKQLTTFKAQHGTAPRTFYASMFEDLIQQFPSTNPLAWPVPPPFEPIVVPKAASRNKTRWYSFTALGSYVIHMYTRRYYFAPRLRRSSALKELEVLKTNMPMNQDLERKFRAMLQYFKKSNAELSQNIETLRAELAHPYEIFEAVPAYSEYASAARRYFSDEKVLRSHETLPPVAAVLGIEPVPVTQDLCIRPSSLFKSFVEHHGVGLNHSTWAMSNDDDRGSSLTLADECAEDQAGGPLGGGEEALFSPLTATSSRILKLR